MHTHGTGTKLKKYRGPTSGCRERLVSGVRAGLSRSKTKLSAARQSVAGQFRRHQKIAATTTAPGAAKKRGSGGQQYLPLQTGTTCSLPSPNQYIHTIWPSVIQHRRTPPPSATLNSWEKSQPHVARLFIPCRLGNTSRHRHRPKQNKRM